MISDPLRAMALDAEKNSWEYHFRNMHVYINSNFSKLLYSPTVRIKKDHHVHIFMWNLNIDDVNLMAMMNFIGLANALTGKPVYVHIPKRASRSMYYLRPMLESFVYNGRHAIMYKLIIEKNSNTTIFKFGDWIPINVSKIFGHKPFPRAHLVVGWYGPREIAFPTFWDPETNNSETYLND